MEFDFEQVYDSNVKIKVIGVGGGGNNAVNRMISTNIRGVEFIAVNTDSQAINTSCAAKKLVIGEKITRGKGAGSNPDVGKRSAEESIEAIKEVLHGADMVFVTTGMGGGTGTGAAPVVAEIAKKLGILTVCVVTKPFAFEGKKRADNAEDGICKLEEYADALIVIPNENLKKISTEKITLVNAFSIADNVLVQTVKNIVETIRKTSYINRDFADIHSIVNNSGRMHTATACASGKNRAEEIVNKISDSQLLDTSVNGADGVLLCITASSSVALDEIDKISSEISKKASEDADVIIGMDFDDSMNDTIKAMVIATTKNKH